VIRRSGRSSSQNWPCEYGSEQPVKKTLDDTSSTAYNQSMTKRQTKKLTDQLRQLIDDSGLTRYQIAKKTGIDESALAKFYNGHRGLSMEGLNALGEYLELTIVMRRKPNVRGR